MFEVDLIKVAGLVLGLLTITLVAWAVSSRGRNLLEDKTARWLLLLAFVVLTPLTYVVSFATGIDSSKTVAFCNSCHVMESRVKNMKDPDSEYLAAKHYQYRWIADKQCYQCHTDYGHYGGIKAKIAGLRHVWANYIVGYDLPLKIWKTYNNQTCLYCHRPVLDYQEEPEHEDILEDLEQSKMSCLGSNCHVSSHPKEEMDSGI